MTAIAKKRIQSRIARHARVRKSVVGTAECPRLAVRRSLSHMVAQIIDDANNKSLVQVSTTAKDFQGKFAEMTKTEQAKQLGLQVAEVAPRAVSVIPPGPVSVIPAELYVAVLVLLDCRVVLLYQSFDLPVLYFIVLQCRPFLRASRELRRRSVGRQCRGNRHCRRSRRKNCGHDSRCGLSHLHSFLKTGKRGHLRSGPRQDQSTSTISSGS